MENPGVLLLPKHFTIRADSLPLFRGKTASKLLSRQWITIAVANYYCGSELLPVVFLLLQGDLGGFAARVSEMRNALTDLASDSIIGGLPSVPTRMPTKAPKPWPKNLSFKGIFRPAKLILIFKVIWNNLQNKGRMTIFRLFFFSGRGWGQQLFSSHSPAVHWIAQTSSLNCHCCRILTKPLIHWIASPFPLKNPFL